MQSGLYLIGTPIGNLGDMSPRAIETLRGVDLIAAEDTRVFGKLATHFDIKTRRIAMHEHNEREMAEKIAAGKVNKFLKDNTLMAQPFVKDNAKSVAEYLKSTDAELKVTGFKRVALG